jgi:hypothetical protein
VFKKEFILLSACIGSLSRNEISKAQEKAAGQAITPYFSAVIFQGCRGKLIVTKWFLLYFYQNWDCRLCSDDSITQKLSQILSEVVVLARIGTWRELVASQYRVLDLNSKMTRTYQIA